MDNYTVALINKVHQWGGKLNRPIDTVYLGGGTPSLLAHRLPIVLEEVRKAFDVEKDAEITLEINPTGDDENILNFAKIAGVNRLSIGMQSGIDRELKILGRGHSVKKCLDTVNIARKKGFSNISIDLMIGLPDSNNNTLTESLKLVKNLNPEHISSYILKLEENTAFFKEKDKLNLPDDEYVAEQYLLMCDFFENAGYEHYEISNFCKNGKKSRHNIKYWLGNDCLGIGPAAHSALNGKRFYYPKDLKAFINGNAPIPDGNAGGIDEYIMLRLRMKDGISLCELQNRFCYTEISSFNDKCNIFKNAGLMNIIGDNISLTNSGMLLSNSIIAELLE